MKKKSKVRGPLTPKGGMNGYSNQSVQFLGVHGREHRFLLRSGRDDLKGSMQRQAILNRNREWLEHEAVKAVSRGESDFAFLCLEIDDNAPVSADVLEFARKTRSMNGIPTAQLQMPRVALYERLKGFQQELHKQGKGDPRTSPIVEDVGRPAMNGRFWVVVMAARGKLATQLAIPTEIADVEPTPSEAK